MPPLEVERDELRGQGGLVAALGPVGDRYAELRRGADSVTAIDQCARPDHHGLDDAVLSDVLFEGFVLGSG